MVVLQSQTSSSLDAGAESSPSAVHESFLTVSRMNGFGSLQDITDFNLSVPPLHPKVDH